jgi:hypothetical protein
MTMIEFKDMTFYMDNKLTVELAKVRKGVTKKDKDHVFAVDGAEGCGKSVFSMQLAATLDPTFCIDRVCFTAPEFTRAIVKAKKGEAVIFDEAFTGLSSRAALSEVNKLLVSLMMEMRQKNLFVIVVMPTFFLLDKYVALWRATGLFHVFTKDGRRGYWLYFNKYKKKMLYLAGKKYYTYSGKNIPRSGFKGKFYDQYTVDEKEYRKRKKTALESKRRTTKAEIYINQRNLYMLLLNKTYGISARKISIAAKEIKGYGEPLSERQTQVIIKDFDKNVFTSNI